jgi:hypothetical protein
MRYRPCLRVDERIHRLLCKRSDAPAMCVMRDMEM